MTFQSTLGPFRNKFAEDIFIEKYRHADCETWDDLCETLVNDVCLSLMSQEDLSQLKQYMKEMKFIPGGRYLYYAGRESKFFNNCIMLSALEDSREDWAELSKKFELALSSGSGAGANYSVYRAKGTPLRRTGGVASGPLPKMQMTNDIGKAVIQGGGRRSAIYASLSWKHADVNDFLVMKNWYDMPVAGTDLSMGHLKEKDFNFNCPMDMTNISINYDTDWIVAYWETKELHETFLKNCRQALSTAEPGFSFNFFDKENETLRNPCCEVSSEDDSDVCNLGSINLGNIDSVPELMAVTELAIKFLLCGTFKADLPYEKVYDVREKNRRLGLGLMGVHEWLLKRGYKYEINDELKHWLYTYKAVSDQTAKEFANEWSCSIPVATRAIAPTGSIGILAGTTTGIEPLYAVAFKRRYLKTGSKWHYQYVIDSTSKEMIDLYDVDPSSIETSLDLAGDYERRISFQADVQDYVDMAISSTINLPKWGSEGNNESNVEKFAHTLASYAHRLRGFTCYPDGARGGQPLVAVDYADAVAKLGEEFEEHVETTDVCDITGKGGSCGS